MRGLKLRYATCILAKIKSHPTRVRGLKREIATNPLYTPTKRAFLQNPNVDYSTATRVLGNNYIKWRYNDPAYAEGHARRDGWYQKINNLVGAKPNLSNQRYPQQYRPQPTFQDPTAGMDSFQLVAYLFTAT